MSHQEKSEYVGKEVIIRESATHFQFPNFGGSVMLVEDWWDRVYGESWMSSDGNPAALVYAMRSVDNNLPTDNEVLYGKVGGFGHLVHIKEVSKCSQVK